MASFGLLGALAIFADSGAANFVLANPRNRLSRADFRGVLTLHIGVALIGSTITVATCWALYADVLPFTGLLTIAALALSQSFDSGVRAARAPLLRNLQEARFAAADGLLAIAKLPFMILALTLGQLSWLWALPVASFVVFAVTTVNARSHLLTGPRRIRLIEVLKVGASGAASAIYSQAPLVTATLFLPVSQAAQLAAVYRVIQPVEILPSTAMQQVMPRLISGRMKLAPAWWAFVAGGSAIALASAFLLPVVEWLLALPIEPAIYLVVLLSLPMKFGNYLAAGALLVAGRAGLRLLIALIVGAITIAASILAVGVDGGVAVASCTILAELLLAIATFSTLRQQMGKGEGKS